MNNRFLFFFIFSFLFIFSTPVRADEEEFEKELKDTLVEAISKGEPLVTLSVKAVAPIEQDNVPQARSDALQTAFRNIVVIATEHLVSQERVQEISDTIETKIYNRSKNFIHHFKPLKSEIVETEYHLPVEVTLSLKELKKALIESRILAFDYTAKMIRLLNLKRYEDYEWIREVLEKDTEQVKRLVETYQKKGELHLKVETSTSLEELMVKLNRAKSEEGAPSFRMNVYSGVSGPGILEITLL